MKNAEVQIVKLEKAFVMQVLAVYVQTGAYMTSNKYKIITDRKLSSCPAIFKQEYGFVLYFMDGFDCGETRENNIMVMYCKDNIERDYMVNEIIEALEEWDKNIGHKKNNEDYRIIL